MMIFRNIANYMMQVVSSFRHLPNRILIQRYCGVVLASCGRGSGAEMFSLGPLITSRAEEGRLDSDGIPWWFSTSVSLFFLTGSTSLAANGKKLRNIGNSIPIAKAATIT